MKKLLTCITLTSSLLLLSSCNEKVSPALESGDSLLTPAAVPAAAGGYTFKLENTSASILGFNLHKTGDYSKKCTINKTSFSSDDYIANQADYDITCFLEAEELGLYFNGFKWKLTASANACEYVAYSPYSFYKYQPGSSTRTIRFNSCDDSVVGALPDPNYQSCDSYYDQTFINAGGDTDDENANTILTDDPHDDFAFTIADEEEQRLCYFDHSTRFPDDADAPNCDVGTITIQEYAYIDDPTNPGTTILSGAAPTTRTIKCGGKVANCVDGPIRATTTGFTMINEITATDDGTTYTKSYEYTSPYNSSKTMNLYLANYSRQCSGENHDNLTPDYSAFAFQNTIFLPNLLDNYSRNITRDGSNAIVSSPTIDFGASLGTYPSNLWDNVLELDGSFDPSATPIQRVRYLASDPFLGSARVQPFYAFYCLDEAREVKARIRVMVRDWDRIFPSNSANQNYLSDVDQEPNSLMDNPIANDEIPDEDENFNYWNDYLDWDDVFNFEVGDTASAGLDYIPGALPQPQCQMPANGFGHPDNFLNGALDWDD